MALPDLFHHWLLRLPLVRCQFFPFCRSCLILTMRRFWPTVNSLNLAAPLRCFSAHYVNFASCRPPSKHLPLCYLCADCQLRWARQQCLSNSVSISKFLSVRRPPVLLLIRFHLLPNLTTSYLKEAARFNQAVFTILFFIPTWL